MNAEFLLACGVVFRRTADLEAAWQLVEGLASEDAALRVLAQTFLVEGGAVSMSMLETALAAGVVDSDVVGPCMVEILASQRAAQPTKIITDRSLC